MAMQLNRFREIAGCRSAWISLACTALLLGALTAQACSATQLQTQPANQFAARIKTLAELMLGDTLSLAQAQSILGGNITDQKKSHYAVIEGPEHRTVATIAEKDEKKSVTELMIYPHSDIGLVLKYLEEAFGEWRQVHESKTSSVLFEVTSAGRKNNVAVYATLLFPATEPTAPVVSIRIRKRD